MGYQFNLIRIAGNYLTADGLVGGSRYISEIEGIDKLVLTRQSSVVTAIDGTPYKQFTSNKGLPVSIRFPLLDTTTFNTIVTAINSADAAGTAISLYITGSIGTFDLSVVSSGIEAPSTAIVAGLYDVTFNFITSAVHKTLSMSAGSYALAGQDVTLTHTP